MTENKSHELPLAELRVLPGFDELRHRSTLVDETVELRDGRPTVVYRTKREITQAALRQLKTPAFKVF